jgi:hypothetical protein
MKVWFFLFLAGMLSAIVLLQQRESMTCKRPIYGPPEIPSIYGPDEEPVSNPVQQTPVAKPSATEDDGKFSSNTAHRNPYYARVYSYHPPLEKAFPVEEGEPQPFLTNFDRIGR